MPTSIAAPAALGFATVGALAWCLVRALRRRTSPEERERRRRIHLHVNGRLAEAHVDHLAGSRLHYGYEIAGVAYETVQDIAALEAYLPCPAEHLIGVALAKFDPHNPANSILVCEHWHGFKIRQPQI